MVSISMGHDRSNKGDVENIPKVGIAGAVRRETKCGGVYNLYVEEI